MIKKHHHYFIVSLLAIIAGAWVYHVGRNDVTRYESWLGLGKDTHTIPMAGWLPDYLWSLSLLFAVAGAWKGWTNVPAGWKWLLWAAITITEPLQLWGVLGGTADIGDLLAYQFSFITIYYYEMFLSPAQYTTSHEKDTC